MEMSPSMLRELLEDLSAWLAFEECEPVEWVVCGGLALTLQGLQSRTTRDVDVLGEWNVQKVEMACIEGFPEQVQACIERVAEEHPQLSGMGARWINLGPSQLARWGLPKGFEQRLVMVRISDRLALHLLGREDLLALKLYAAADAFAPRQEIHFGDLRALNPTFEALDKAVDWMRTLPDFEEKRTELKEVVRRLGYDDIAYYI